MPARMMQCDCKIISIPKCPLDFSDPFLIDAHFLWKTTNISGEGEHGNILHFSTKSNHDTQPWKDFFQLWLSILPFLSFILPSLLIFEISKKTHIGIMCLELQMGICETNYYYLFDVTSLCQMTANTNVRVLWECAGKEALENCWFLPVRERH